MASHIQKELQWSTTKDKMIANEGDLYLKKIFRNVIN